MNKVVTDNKRIAKNTLMLYIRMFLMMGISLYTSRAILQVLGVENYGIYNVVGGLVSMFGIFSGSMSSATQRYITIALGKGDLLQLKKIFNISLQIHVIIGLFTIFLIETIGLWFLYSEMQIPAERMYAAFWIVQFSAFTCLVSIISVPYNAAIVAHERMSAFAYISILEAALKLVIVYMLLAIPCDKLITYGFLLVVVQVSVCFFYMSYCRRHFPESKFQFYRDSMLMKAMMGFAGWNMFGALSGIAFGQGLNMLLNVFFGPVVNAARAIAQQVQGAIQLFITNFQTAVNPQIIKNYAVENFEQMHLLMSRSSRFSYYLMLLLSLPVIFETPYILKLWLGVVPENTVIFLRLIIVTTLIYTIINPILVANNATGKVKSYYIVCGCMMISILPISYVVLKCGFPAYSVFVVHLCVEMITQLVRLLMVRSRLKLSLRAYIMNVYLPIFFVTMLSVIIPFYVWNSLDSGFVRLFVVTIISVLSIIFSVVLVGLSKSEKMYIYNKSRQLLRRGCNDSDKR